MTEKIEVGDIRGDLVSVGDKIAYAVRQGNSAALRVGTIVGIVPKHTRDFKYQGESKGVTMIPTKIKVALEDGSTTTILAYLKRFVKVGE